LEHALVDGGDLGASGRAVLRGRDDPLHLITEGAPDLARLLERRLRVAEHGLVFVLL
jgi:hypothetical protein